MADIDLRRWLASLSWPPLLAVIAAMMALTFALNCVIWWMAQQLSWWAFALILTLGLFARLTIGSIIRVVRERRKPPSPVQQVWLP